MLPAAVSIRSSWSVMPSLISPAGSASAASIGLLIDRSNGL